MNNISVDPIALRCVEIGLIDCVNVKIDSNGLKCSIVPGQSLVGTGPFHAFKKYDLEMSLPYLKERLEGEVSSAPSPKGKGAKGPDLVYKPSNLSEARDIVSRFSLDQIERNGVKNILPRDSITVYEFLRPAPAFIARLMLVAEAIGEPKAVSRITTDLSLRINGCSTLEEWWSKSTSDMKWKLVTSRKVSGEVRLGKPSPFELRRLDQCECPFKETRFEVETFKDEDEEETFGGVSFVGY